jgi:hypothetical protein
MVAYTWAMNTMSGRDEIIRRRYGTPRQHRALAFPARTVYGWQKLVGGCDA